MSEIKSALFATNMRKESKSAALDAVRLGTAVRSVRRKIGRRTRKFVNRPLLNRSVFRVILLSNTSEIILRIHFECERKELSLRHLQFLVF